MTSKRSGPEFDAIATIGDWEVGYSSSDICGQRLFGSGS
jgi:hypothetical protein